MLRFRLILFYFILEYGIFFENVPQRRTEQHDVEERAARLSALKAGGRKGVGDARHGRWRLTLEG